MDRDTMELNHSRRALRRRARRLSVITTLSVIVAVFAVIFSVIMTLYYRNQNKQMMSSLEAVNAEKEALESVEEKKALEAVSSSVYNQSEVDALVDLAKKDAELNSSKNFLDTIQQRLLGGDSTMTVLRDLYPDNIVMLDSGQYYFFPMNEELMKNNYQNEQFITMDTGEVFYAEGIIPSIEETEDGTRKVLNMEELLSVKTTQKGIDVSRYQGEIDWEAVKNDGVTYAIIRLGIRGYSEGAIVEDECYRKNVEGALASGIPVGVYFFTQAISEQEALEEAQFVIDLLKDYDITYPVYLDVEEIKSAGCRTKDLTKEQRTQYAITFLEAIKNAGYKPGVYGNLKTFMLMLDVTKLETYEKWFACYSLPAYYPYQYQILQYTEKGTVAGIKGGVDVNISFQDYTNEE